MGKNTPRASRWGIAGSNLRLLCGAVLATAALGCFLLRIAFAQGDMPAAPAGISPSGGVAGRAPTSDSNGARLAAPVPAPAPGETAASPAAVGHLILAANFSWTLIAAFLVLFMQAGFALLTCGLVRKKNAAHLMMLNFAAYVVAFIAFYLVGFGLMYGGAGLHGIAGALGGVPTLNHALGSGDHVFLGCSGFLLTGSAYDVRVFALMMFAAVFLETAAYIIVGTVCERITFGAFLLAEVFLAALLYPVYGCWVWGGGWLAQLGHAFGLGHGYIDFAGSTVVHATGAFAAMALATILGPRVGKYDRKGNPVGFPAHNIPFVVTGTFILLFGWMGFNAGSTLSAGDLRIAVVAVNTNLAAVFGSAAAMLYWTLRYKKPDITMACNGMLAGLVAITASSAFVNAPCACLIGILAGLTVSWGVVYNETKLKVDDPCGAVAVHGYCGWLGAICLGLFADGSYGAGWNGVGGPNGVTGLFYGDGRQLLAQLIGSTVCVAWAFGATFAVFKIVNGVRTLRVPRDVEVEGLDLTEFGAMAYPEDAVSGPLSLPDFGGGVRR